MEKDKVLEVAENEVVLDEWKVDFHDTYMFEGKEYKEINLNGLFDLNATDMINADRILQRSGAASFLPEMTMEYTLYIASRATGYPIEFFEQLSMRNALKVKSCVTRFLFGQE